ncbi:MAG: S8 family serine peptidase [Anaerolineales bacterium]|nr:S8 family serine peptidase [Anaerolineales bacterium]
MAAQPAATLVNFVEEDGAVQGTLDIADPYFNDSAGGYGHALIQLSKAWDISTGSSAVIIAVLDTGINRLHPEFKGRVMAGTDFINGDSDPADDHGHGTHVAGIAAAAIDGKGSAGVCPRCKIMPVKVLDKLNEGSWRSVSRGILYAVNHGAHVINLSLGGFASSDTLESAIQYAHDHGVVVVAAAGNGATDEPFYPAALDDVIGVSAVVKKDVFWSLSDYGDYIDVAAPGVGILSSYHDLNFGGGYAFMTGTSMATPFVSGLVGLMLSVDPSLDPDKTVELIRRSR